MKLLNCALYLAVTGCLGFLAGRLLPRNWPDPHKGIFRCFSFENSGKLYEKLSIRKWQKRLPDMSRMFPGLMPPKNLSGAYRERLTLMVRETCVAEMVHWVVSIMGLHCLLLWPGVGGVAVTAIHILLLNLPFILIQRYNRPRLIRLQQRLTAGEKKKEGAVCVS